jgi:hypothetical protein
MSEVVNESDRTTEPDKRVVYVRVNGYADHGANMNRYTTYEVEFRLRDECRVLCQKRYSHFRDLYKTASIVNEEVGTFPPSSARVLFSLLCSKIDSTHVGIQCINLKLWLQDILRRC